MKKRALLTILLAVLLFSSFALLWYQSTQAFDPEDDRTKIFVVSRGENIRQVARRLQDEGLIRSKLVFFLLVKNKAAEKNIQAGTFRLSPSMRPEKIINELSHGTLDIWVTMIEGWRNEQTAVLLEKELGFDAGDFLKSAQIGYMFPDTYAFPKEASPQAVAKIMIANFNQKFDQKLKEAVENEGLTENEGIVLASIIEREAKYAQDRPIIASILLNRLRQDMPLQADATVQYAVASAECNLQNTNCEWWPKNLTKADLKRESPYNTYINVGLPPTPISNPGLASIQAVAYPAKTDYLYYLSDKDGRMHYAETLEEHNENISKYLSN